MKERTGACNNNKKGLDHAYGLSCYRKYLDIRPAVCPVSYPEFSARIWSPIDHGPFTPEASSAYQGGGVILQGAPGAPAPTPEATPPGQTPRNMVPVR